ncbi:hypothetical protein ABZ894_26725 [Nocardia beijingensis]|uniref:hypothetical protein n=1 Tax=Nocardia beijingensis TaxID=95162 RepID=UPI0033F2FF13
MASDPASRPDRDETATNPPPQPAVDAEETNSTTTHESPAQDNTRAKDTTTRSGRYALVAALCAALISSIVSASAAVYVSVDSADREDRLTTEKFLREDRQKSYHDFLANMLAFINKSGGMIGYLRGENFSGFRSDITDFNHLTTEFMASIEIAVITSSDDMVTVLNKFMPPTQEWFEQHWTPFLDKHLKGGRQPAAETDEWKGDLAALQAAFTDFTTKLDRLSTEFINQSRKDLY